MICSSVSRAFFIVRPLHGPDSNRRWRKNPVAGQFANGVAGRDHVPCHRPAPSSLGNQASLLAVIVNTKRERTRAIPR